MRKPLTAGEYLGKHMDQMGVTDGQMAGCLDLKSASNVADWRAGRRKIPVHHVNNLSKYSGCNAETLRNKVLGAKAAKVRLAKAEVKVTVAIRPNWVKVTTQAPPSDRAHLRWDGVNKCWKGVTADAAVHAPHPNITHWAELPDPEGPTE
jgi:hypothetical protein